MNKFFILLIFIFLQILAFHIFGFFTDTTTINQMLIVCIQPDIYVILHPNNLNYGIMRNGLINGCFFVHMTTCNVL